MEPLTDLDRTVLELAKRTHPDATALERLGVDRARYWQLLNGVVDKPAALVAEPMLVNRLRNRRAQRAGLRHRLRAV